jgi:hypothetical protein
MFEGTHAKHQYKKYRDVLHKVAIQFEKYASQDSVALDETIRKVFASLRETLLARLAFYEDYFLK